MPKKRQGGLKKPAKMTHVRKAWAPGDTTMEETDQWVRDGAGVSENCKDVGAMPNESVMNDELPGHII